MLYSFDVKMDGKNACRLTDKKFQNHGNTVDMMGAGGIPVPVPDNFVEVLCRFLRECTEAHDKGGKPTRSWCKQPSGTPGETNAMQRGKDIDACCEKKINDVKGRSKSEFAKTVKTQEWMEVPGLGGSCKPDVVAGVPPNIFDFKTSCPPLPPSAPPPDWPVYGDGTGGTRATKNKSWHGRSQGEVYEKASGNTATMVHANSEGCNP